MLPAEIVTKLKSEKNLLAFSGGGDSTALFFLLLEHNVPFDIAIVDYGLRKQSKEELAYAKELAKKYNLRCHTKKAPKIEKNFEAAARTFRYDFFAALIDTYHYDNLLTAHHLGDRLEWFLMQLCRGAGCTELAGMQMVEERKNYTLLRPLLERTKEELLSYLDKRGIHYFEDATNKESRFLRNAFRHNYAEPLLKEYAAGIKRSFAYIDEDKEALQKECSIQVCEEMAYFFASSQRADLICIDKYLKSRGYLLSHSEKNVLKKRQNSIVGRRYLIVFYAKYIFITPYHDLKPTLPKTFKESCRRLKIEPKMRPFLYEHPQAFDQLRKIVSNNPKYS